VARRRRDAPENGEQGDGAQSRGSRLGFFERSLFSVMGPPQLGDVHAPVPDLPVRPVELCPRCEQPRDEHEVVRTPRLTYTRCAADG
jgi:hypothetical protein